MMKYLLKDSEIVIGLFLHRINFTVLFVYEGKSVRFINTHNKQQFVLLWLFRCYAFAFKKHSNG